MKITITSEDGSTQDFFPQAYTDAAVASALAATPAPTPEAITEVDVVEADKTEKFAPEA